MNNPQIGNWNVNCAVILSPYRNRDAPLLFTCNNANLHQTAQGFRNIRPKKRERTREREGKREKESKSKRERERGHSTPDGFPKYLRLYERWRHDDVKAARLVCSSRPCCSYIANAYTNLGENTQFCANIFISNWRVWMYKWRVFLHIWDATDVWIYTFL